MAGWNKAKKSKANAQTGRKQAAPSSGALTTEDYSKAIQKNAPKKRVKNGSIDLPFLVLVLTLVAFGLVMLFSATYAYCFYHYGDSYVYIRKQLIFAVAGIAAMLVLAFIPYQVWKKFAWVIYGGGVGLLAVTLAMPPINNARRWIVFGGIQFQPSELMKFALVLIFAWLIAKNFDKMGTFRCGVLPFGLVLVPVVLIMVLQPHLSGTILLLALAVLLMLVGGTKLRWFLGAGGAVAAAGGAYILTSNKMAYALERVQMWLDPFADTQDAGFQTVQSLYAIGSGGFWGLGLGNSRQKHLFIPEPQNDFIFAIVCEELGLIGALLVILLFGLLVWRGVVIAIRSQDKFASLVALGLIMQVGIQAILNIAVVTNTVPNTGISLPFFSYGGTSLMMLLGEMGVILSISRSAKRSKQ